MKRLLLLLPLLLLSSCGGSSIRQLDCTITSTGDDLFGDTESFIIDTKTGDRFFLQPDKQGLGIFPRPQMITFEKENPEAKVKYESKIVDGIYLYLHKVSFPEQIFFTNVAIDLSSLKGEFSLLTSSSRSTSLGSCVWAEPPTTVIDQRR